MQTYVEASYLQAQSGASEGIHRTGTLILAWEKIIPADWAPSLLDCARAALTNKWGFLYQIPPSPEQRLSSTSVGGFNYSINLRDLEEKRKKIRISTMKNEMAVLSLNNSNIVFHLNDLNIWIKIDCWMGIVLQQNCNDIALQVG